METNSKKEESVEGKKYWVEFLKGGSFGFLFSLLFLLPSFFKPDSFSFQDIWPLILALVVKGSFIFCIGGFIYVLELKSKKDVSRGNPSRVFGILSFVFGLIALFCFFYVKSDVGSLILTLFFSLFALSFGVKQLFIRRTFTGIAGIILVLIPWVILYRRYSFW